MNSIFRVEADKAENTDNEAKNASAIPVSQVSSATKVVVDGKIVKVLTETRIDKAKKVLIRVMPIGVRDADHDANYIDVNELTDGIAIGRGLMVDI